MPTFQAVFFDMNRNGWPDLYLSTDKGYSSQFHNRLFRNDEGTFVEITNESGTAANIDSMGVAVGDVTGNLLPDLYCTNTWMGNKLFLNQGDGVFTEAAAQAGLSVNNIGWGTLFFDYDNSGGQDVFVCNSSSTNRLFRCTGAWPCEDVSQSAGFDHHGESYIVAAADIDHDGDLDLLVVNYLAFVRRYINHEGQKRNWVRFNVVGTGANRFAVGANVEIRTGSHWQLREVHAGISYKSANEMTLHFGVNQHDMIDEIRVYWPGGMVRSLKHYPANHTWTLYPEAMLGDGTGSGSVTIEDFLIFADCFTGPGPGSIAPGCEMMDFDGDGDVDLDDFFLFLAAYDDPINDCTGNGVPDLLDILLGDASDANDNGIPDACEADLNGDGIVNVLDLLVLLSMWGPCAKLDACPADFTGDGGVDIFDLLFLLANWG